jgi:hypothetical protein
VGGSGYIFGNPYALPLPRWLFLFAWSRAAAREVSPELLQFRKWLAVWSEKPAKQQDANEKKRIDAQLEAHVIAHACWTKEKDERIGEVCRRRSWATATGEHRKKYFSVHSLKIRKDRAPTWHPHDATSATL